MIRIALVGEIASGKTFISKCFRLPTFNADKEVKKIYKKNRSCFKKLKRKFPNCIKNYPIKKSEIKQILNKSNIKVLSKIVHPYSVSCSKTKSTYLAWAYINIIWSW